MKKNAAAELGNGRVPELSGFHRVCARKTTLAQLAEQLSALGEIHGKLLLPVQVRVAAPVFSSGKQLSRRVAE